MGTQFIEVESDQFQSLLFVFVCSIQFIHVPTVFGLQSVDDIIGPFRILTIEVFRDFNQRIGCSRHGRQDHNFSLPIID